MAIKTAESGKNKYRIFLNCKIKEEKARKKLEKVKNVKNKKTGMKISKIPKIGRQLQNKLFHSFCF